MGKDICYGYETAGLGYDLLRRFSKDNRRYMTPAESALWEVLRRKQFGYRFRRQHPIGEYIPDFVCLPKRLVIEVDGGINDKTIKQCNCDIVVVGSFITNGNYSLQIEKLEI